MRIYRLENPVQRYAWGSVDGISEALGIPESRAGAPSPRSGWEPIRARPRRPSSTAPRIGLDELIRRDPEGDPRARASSTSSGAACPSSSRSSRRARPSRSRPTRASARPSSASSARTSAASPSTPPSATTATPTTSPRWPWPSRASSSSAASGPVPEIIENMRLVAPGEFERALERLERDPSRVELSVFFYGLISADEARARAGSSPPPPRGSPPALESGKVPAGREGAFRWASRIMELLPRRRRRDPAPRPQPPRPRAGRGRLHRARRAPRPSRGHLPRDHGQLGQRHPRRPHAEIRRPARARLRLELQSREAPAACCPRRSPPARRPTRSSSPTSRSRGSPSSRGRLRTELARGPEILSCASGEAEISCPGEAPLRLGRGDSAFVAADACDYRARRGRRPAAAPRFSATSVPPRPRTVTLWADGDSLQAEIRRL